MCRWLAIRLLVLADLGCADPAPSAANWAPAAPAAVPVHRVDRAITPPIGPAGPSVPPRIVRSIDPVSVAVLKQAIEDKDYATRLIAIEAMGVSRSEVFVAQLERALGDPEHDVRMAAVDALRAIGSARTVTLLRSVRDDTAEELDVRTLAAGAVLMTGP